MYSTPPRRSASAAANSTKLFASAGKPTGSVVIKNGATVLGTVALSNGSATLTTSKLPKGTDTITANYGGSADYKTRGAAVSQVVK